MIPIISRLMYKNKHVELYYLSAAVPKHVDITSYAHHSEDLLSFLDIKVLSYEISDLVVPALILINRWHQEFGEKRPFSWCIMAKRAFLQTVENPDKCSKRLIRKAKSGKIHDRGQEENAVGRH